MLRWGFLWVMASLLLGSLPAYGQEEASYLKRSIYFGGGSYAIDPFQERELFKFIDSLGRAEAYTITIHSYTDNIGGAEYNAWLSDMRSQAVIYMLLKKALSLDQIETREFGQFYPVYDNRTWEGRQKNRRVDIIFWPLAM